MYVLRRCVSSGSSERVHSACSSRTGYYRNTVESGRPSTRPYGARRACVRNSRNAAAFCAFLGVGEWLCHAGGYIHTYIVLLCSVSSMGGVMGHRGNGVKGTVVQEATRSLFVSPCNQCLFLLPLIWNTRRRGGRRKEKKNMSINDANRVHCGSLHSTDCISTDEWKP